MSKIRLLLDFTFQQSKCMFLTIIFSIKECSQTSLVGIFNICATHDAMLVSACSYTFTSVDCGHHFVSNGRMVSQKIGEKWSKNGVWKPRFLKPYRIIYEQLSFVLQRILFAYLYDNAMTHFITSKLEQSEAIKKPRKILWQSVNGHP